MTYIKENITTKLQKLYSLPRNPREGCKLPALFVKKPLCMGNLSPVHKIFIERPDEHFCIFKFILFVCYLIVFFMSGNKLLTY